MKKFLLIGALVVASLANAQNIDLSKVQKVQFSGEKAQFVDDLPVQAQFEWRDSKNYIEELNAFRAPKPVEYDAADTYYAPGSFYLGLYEGLSGYNLGFIQFPLMDTAKYINAYGATSWSVNGKLVAENTATYATRYWINGMYYMPETADHDLEIGDETYSIKGTMYGNGTKGQYVLSAMEGKWLNGENSYLTLCAMETDTLTDTGDFYMVGGKQTGDPYQDGCGIHLDSADRVTTADTLGILVDNRGLMKIEKILYPIYNANQLNDSLVFPVDAVLRVALFPFTNNGIDFTDTIAATEITRKDFVNAGANWGTIGTLAAKFYDTDIFGATTQVPVYVNGNFYVQLTNFNESGCDFGIYEDFHNPFTGTTVYQYKGQISPRYSRGAGGKWGQNLGVSFDAYWPTLINDTTTTENAALPAQPAEGWDLNAPAAGGFAYYDEDTENQASYLYSNVYPEDWAIDYDVDWIEVVVDTTYWSNYGVAMVGIYAEEIPADVETRSAVVTIDADGAEQTFNITQINDRSALVTTKPDELFDNKLYNVLGIEVGEDYKGVVIRNGEKFIR
ncbi:MAG: BACON domain-containing protein [Paludibacteraceae bacterium]|nr:BACON domain-containing protein [Paludibacteraceae bacterium]